MGVDDIRPYLAKDPGKLEHRARRNLESAVHFVHFEPAPAHFFPERATPEGREDDPVARVAQAFTGDRVTYAMAITDGRTAPEIAGNRPAAAEVSALWKEIKSCFNESSKPTKQRRSISNG